MPRLRSSATTLVALLLIPVLLTSCTAEKSDDRKPAAGNELPAGPDLLTGSAARMRDVKSTKFLITAEGQIAGLALRRADGVLTKEGNAKGSAQVDQFGATVELQFVIVGDKAYIKGPTGAFQALPLALASNVYDPSAILDPERGIAKVLGTAKNPKTEAREAVDSREAYRVAATIDGPTLSAIVPGATGELPGKLWIGADPKHLLKATFTLGTGTVVITFSEFDAPVTISAP